MNSLKKDEPSVPMEEQVQKLTKECNPPDFTWRRLLWLTKGNWAWSKDLLFACLLTLIFRIRLHCSTDLMLRTWQRKLSLPMPSVRHRVENWRQGKIREMIGRITNLNNQNNQNSMDSNHWKRWKALCNY